MTAAMEANEKHPEASHGFITPPDLNGSATTVVDSAPATLPSDQASAAETRQKAGQWFFEDQMRQVHEQRVQSGMKSRELGMAWQNLTVEVLGVDLAVNHNAFSQFNLLNFIRSARHEPPQRKILVNSHDCVKPG